MRAFRRLVLECFYKQKTTKITLNFPKIIEMHLNSSSQCIQLAMRQANKREKNNYGKEKNSNSFALTLGLNPRPLAYNLSFVPEKYAENMLHGKYVNLLYIYRLFLASAIYDCVPLYTAKGTVATEPYLLFNTILTNTSRHRSRLPAASRGYLTVIQYYNAIRLSAEPIGSIL
jgi:hypothetical protein